MSPLSYDRISKTAKVVAFLRAKTDIPYCHEIAQMCGAEEASRQSYGNGIEWIANRRPQVELRFKSLNVMIHKLGVKQVLELASGVAPRGLILSDDPSMTIVETDLPDICEEKRQIVESLIDWKARPNYELYPANALDMNQLWGAVHSFSRQPIQIVQEGFFQHIDRAERRQVAPNIKRLLRFFRGSVWLMTDILTRDEYERYSGDSKQATTSTTGRNMFENAWIDYGEAEKFFDDEGLDVERVKQIKLVPEILNGITDPNVLARIHMQEIWAMRLKG